MRPRHLLRDSSAIYQCQSRGISNHWRLQTSEHPLNDHETTSLRETEGLQIDEHGKTVRTAAGDLPLSPVMDSTFWQARDRFRKKKVGPGKPSNALERKFRKNPFAQALATPVRLDPATKLRLPAFFLQDFNIISHPETGAPWWVPRSLALRQSPLSRATEAGEGETTGEYGDEDPALDEATVVKASTGTEAKEPSSKVAADIPPDSVATAQRDTVLGPSAYVLAHQNLIRSFRETKPRGAKGLRTSSNDTGNGGSHRRMFGPSSSKFRALSGRAVWREDMDEFVLGQMREQIVRDLLYLSRLCETDSRYYIARCYGWKDIKFKHKGAVLWLGGDDDAQPGLFATYDIDAHAQGHGKTSLVVHNLPMLLGPKLMEKVRKEAAVFKDGLLFMLAGRRTTDLQLRLWKLQGYIHV